MVAGVTVKSAPLALAPRSELPVPLEYHLMELPLEVAFSLEDAPAQTEGGVEITVAGAAGETLMVISDPLGLLIMTGLLDTTLIL